MFPPKFTRHNSEYCMNLFTIPYLNIRNSLALKKNTFFGLSYQYFTSSACPPSDDNRIAFVEVLSISLISRRIGGLCSSLVVSHL